MLFASLLLLLLLNFPLQRGGLLGGGGLHWHVWRGGHVGVQHRGLTLVFPRFLDGEYRLLVDRLAVLPDVGVPRLALLRLAVCWGDLPGAVGVVHVTVYGALVNVGLPGRGF